MSATVNDCMSSFLPWSGCRNAAEEDVDESLREHVGGDAAVGLEPLMRVVEHPEESQTARRVSGMVKVPSITPWPQRSFDDALEVPSRSTDLLPRRVVADRPPLMEEDDHLVVIVAEVAGQGVPELPEMALAGSSGSVSICSASASRGSISRR